MYSFCEPFFICIQNTKGTGVFGNTAEKKKSATHTEDIELLPGDSFISPSLRFVYCVIPFLLPVFLPLILFWAIVEKKDLHVCVLNKYKERNPLACNQHSTCLAVIDTNIPYSLQIFLSNITAF